MCDCGSNYDCDCDCDCNQKKHSSSLVTLQELKTYDINDITHLIYHIECILFKLNNNYIFIVHNTPYTQQPLHENILKLKKDIEHHKRHLYVLQQCSLLKYDYLSDIPESLETQIQPTQTITDFVSGYGSGSGSDTLRSKKQHHYVNCLGVKSNICSSL